MEKTRLVFLRVSEGKSRIFQLDMQHAHLLSKGTLSTVDVFCICDKCSRLLFMREYDLNGFELIISRLKGKQKC